MAQVYRVSVNSKVPAAGNQLYFDAVIERRTGTSPDWVWLPLIDGHRTVILGAQAVLDIYAGPGTNVQKRQAIQDLIKAEALAMGIDKADEADVAMSDLFPPAQWPIQVTIRQ
jgi:hypothetical protein